MKLRTKYLLFVLLLHGVTLALTFQIFREDKVLFIFSEGVVLISLALAWQLYKELIQPLKTLMTGIDTLKDQDFNVKFRPTGKYEMDQLIGIYNQMVDRLRLERTRQEQQHFFLEKLIDTSPTGIIILDHDNKVEHVNPKALSILEASEEDVKGSLLNELEQPVLAQIASLQSGASKTISTDGISKYKVQLSHFIDRGFPRNFIMIEELTAELLEAEKQVYGKVIRMMAHEVNNTIGPVNSILSSTLKSPLFKNEDAGTFQNALEVAIERNNHLNAFVRNFADLVKLPPPVFRQMDLRKLLQHVYTLMKERAAERSVQLLLDAGEEPFLILGDEQQLEQALINITKNAVEAIDANGVVSILFGRSQRRLVIRDTGKGISAEESQRLFTPFFSTKKDGQGIGLTLVREILLNHQFAFSLKTIAAGQTEFSITF